MRDERTEVRRLAAAFSVLFGAGAAAFLFQTGRALSRGNVVGGIIGGAFGAVMLLGVGLFAFACWRLRTRKH